ncbi:MAG: endonuclease/exonuclease/phosphatase family protein [Eubacteriales bacterium]
MIKTKKVLSAALKVLLAAAAAAVAAFIVYFIYLLCAYHRLDDNIVLDISGSSDIGTAETGTEYTVMTWNLGFGAYSSDFSFFMDGGDYSRARSADEVNSNISHCASLAAELAPDFLLLQEIDTDSDRSMHIDETEILAPYFDGYYSVFAQNYDSPYLFYPFSCPHGASRSGVLTFSRFSVTSSLRRSLPVETGFSRFLDLDRCYSVTRIPVSDGSELCLYNIHLSAYTTDGTIADEQLEMLVSDMVAEYNSGNYIVCGGDFNKDLPGNSAEIFGVTGGEFTWAQPIPDGIIPESLSLVACVNAPSCRNADSPYTAGSSFVLTVDGFIVSDNVTVVSSAVIDDSFVCSDHNPVVMTFILGD